MARNEIGIDASPAEVFDVLLDGCAYADWVVGAKDIRDVDEGWPAPGTAFHHRVGIGALSLKDRTEVERLEEPSLLVLRARALPAGIARVTMAVSPRPGGGSTVVMGEEAIGGPAAHIPRFLLDPLVWLRNTESLRRLRNLVTRRAANPARTGATSAR